MTLKAKLEEDQTVCKLLSNKQLKTFMEIRKTENQQEEDI